MSVFRYCPNIRLEVVRDRIEVSFGIAGLPPRSEPGLSIMGSVMLQEEGAQAPYLYHGIYSYQSPRANLLARHRSCLMRRRRIQQATRNQCHTT
jgi:hypothetical protein